MIKSHEDDKNKNIHNGEKFSYQSKLTKFSIKIFKSLWDY